MQPPEVTQALGELNRTIGRALDLIRAMPPDQITFESATELSAILREASDAAARLRGQTAGRIRDAEQLSLAGLAQRFGISRSRAHQLVGPDKEKP